MTSTGAAAAPFPLSRPHTGTLLGQTMSLVAATSGLFALGAYVGRTAPQLAADIFLDALNVFLFFLPIFGGESE
jgi:hypothetical protein